MSPSFPFFLGFLFYLAISGVTLIIFVPQLFFKPRRRYAIKFIATVLISYPCLAIVLAIFSYPALKLIQLEESWKLIPVDSLEKLLSIKTLVILFVDLCGILLCAASALYLWLLASCVIYKCVDKEPVTEVFKNDKVLKFIRSYF